MSQVLTTAAAPRLSWAPAAMFGAQVDGLGGSMICPHCATSLLHRERTGSVCSKCGRRFALEPKDMPLKRMS